MLVLILAAAAATPPFVMVLGVAQDAGHPQAGTPPGAAWAPERQRSAACLAVIEPDSGRRYLFEATPDFREQLHALDLVASRSDRPGLDAIFVTHGHIGHYAGLMHLGREAMGAKGVPVYARPRMLRFLKNNGPWSLLVKLGNIGLRKMPTEPKGVSLGRLFVQAFEVPHRDEFTETVGYIIRGPTRSVAFLPDIDKWETWGEGRLRKLVDRVDRAYIDGTFYADGEIPGRAMAEIPHPFIAESLARMAKWPTSVRKKVRFIHLNRTNPALWPGPARQRIRRSGADVAEPGERFPL